MFRDVRAGTPPDYLFDSPHALGQKSGTVTATVETV